MSVHDPKSQSPLKQNRLGTPASKILSFLLKHFGHSRKIVAWVSLSSALLLIALAAVGQLALLLDPYRHAARDVAALLENQSTAEQSLGSISNAAAALSDRFALGAAQKIAQSHGSVNEQLAVAAFTRRGIRSPDAIMFIGLMDSLAHEILGLSQALQPESLAANLAPLLSQLREEGGGRPDILDQLSIRIPPALEQIDNQRLRVQTTANGAYVILETPQFQPILNELEDIYAHPDAVSEPILLDYALAIHSWKALPRSCESLEIQLAGNAAILGELLSAVQAANLQAGRLGYSLVKPAADWINRRIAAVLSTSIFFLLITFAVLIWEGRVSLRMPPWKTPAWLPTPSAWFRKTSWAGFRGMITGRTAKIRKVLRGFFTPSHISHRRPQFSTGEVVLQVIQTGLPKAVKRLSQSQSLRIGSDPLDPVYIASARPGEIDVWIRPAKVSFFIEVRKSSAPVLLNGQPISGARRLQNGDSIQILDTLLLFLEGYPPPA